MLDISNFKKSTYYYNRKPKQEKYSVEKGEISVIHKKSGKSYGYRRITCIMRQNGYVINHKTVQKLMKEQGIQGKYAKKKFRVNKEEQGDIKENLLNREFTSIEPREKLTTDVTEFKVNNTKIYLSPVIDMYNGEIVSYAISETPNMEMVKEMLNKLWGNGIPKGALLHSDQGSIYTSKAYQRILQEHGIRQSMSRKGNCYDNSVIENFFGIMKREMYNGERYNSPEELKQEIERYISYYNNDRISLKLNGLSPVQYRAEYEKTHLKQ